MRLLVQLLVCHLSGCSCFTSAPAAGAGNEEFVPVSTDCIKWVKINRSVHLEPGTTYPGRFSPNSTCGEMHCFEPIAPLLMVGHQVCMEEVSDGHGGALLFPTGGVWGELLCMTLNGSLAGHVDFSNHTAGFSCFDVASSASGMSCFTYSPGGAAWPAPQATGVTHDFWMATYSTRNLTWTAVSKGSPVPSNAYEIGGMLLARSLKTKADSKKGFVGGNVLPGFVVPAGGALGPIQFEDYGSFQDDAYELATCHNLTVKPWRCDYTRNSCVESNSSVRPDNSTTFATQQECAAKCVPPPPPPLSQNPCIRFGHTVPVGHHVDVEITQPGPPAISHTWANYKFGDFSDWCEEPKDSRIARAREY